MNSKENVIIVKNIKLHIGTRLDWMSSYFNFVIFYKLKMNIKLTMN